MLKHILRCLYLVVLYGYSLAHAGAYEDFFTAVSRDDAATVVMLLRRGFDADSRDPKGQPAITLAVQRGSGRVVQALLGHPMLDVNVLNQAGESALMLAAIKGDVPLCEQLLAHGARAELPGWAPLHYAASGPSPRVVELLLAHGVAVDSESPNRSTPLMMAARYGSEESVQLLLAKGADPKRRNERDLNAGDFARLAGRERLAERLSGMAH
jgi:uncharacterized protein